MQDEYQNTGVIKICRCAKCGKTNTFPSWINPAVYGWVRINGKNYCYACDPEGDEE